VTARLMDRQYKKIGPVMSAISQLDSAAHNPSYKFYAEIHESNLPPTAMLLFKVCKLGLEIDQSCGAILLSVVICCLLYSLISCISYIVHTILKKTYSTECFVSCQYHSKQY